MKTRKLLMIPGPIEFEPTVLQAIGAPTPSHVAPDFIETFAESLDRMKQVWACPSGQPFILAGSGTLAMDSAGANMIEQGDHALVISTGYFGERFAALLERYGANVTVLEAEPGETVSLDRIDAELSSRKYKLLTVTHVDTSTAVRVDPEPIGKLADNYGVISVLDGVCSVGGEEVRQEEWGIDVVLTASQKAIGVPPGLALMVASPRALNIWKERKSPVQNYYGDWNNWLPIMEAYGERRPAYFGTPPVNLIAALHKSLQLILDEGMPARIKRHSMIAQAFRSAMSALGLEMIPVTDSIAANTLSAPYYPSGIEGGALLSAISEAGVIVAGGLLPDLKNRYFRVGHMGSTSPNDILTTVGAIERALHLNGHKVEPDAGVAAAQRTLS